MDYLSTCTSLLQILQLVDNQDILNCRDINQIIQKFVKNNYSGLARQELETITVNINREGKETVVSLRIFVDESETVFHVSRKKGMVRKPLFDVIKNDFFSEFIKEKHGDLIAGDSNPAWFRLATAGHVYTCAEVGEELRSIFTFIFRRYTVNKISMESLDAIPENWLNAISDGFKNSRSRCNEIVVSENLPGLKRLVETTGCSLCLTHMSQTDDDFIEDLLTMLTWNRQLRIYTRLDLTMIPLLEKWETGELTLDRIEFNGSGTDYGQGRWFQEMLDIVLGRLKHATMYVPLDFNDSDDSRHIHIQRPIDDKILRLTSSKLGALGKIVFNEL